jgi:hypothetical protein
MPSSALKVPCCCRLICSRKHNGFALVSSTTLVRHALADAVDECIPAGTVQVARTVAANPPPVVGEGDSDPDSDDDLVPVLVDAISDDEGGGDEMNDDAAPPAAPDEYADDFFASENFASWADKLNREVDDDEYNELLLGELLLTFFEWMCVHKTTLASARAVHGLLSLLLPPATSNFPTWAKMKHMLDLVYDTNVVEVDLCPNNHIAFWTPTHPVLLRAGYGHGHRTHCPYPNCGAARYLWVGGKRKSVKKGYYFPLDTFVQGIFRDADLDASRKTTADTSPFPPGHIRFSKGWYDKMTNNPQMNEWSQGLIAAADGVPMFRHKASKSVVICILRQANQPDHLSKKFGKMHLSFLYPCEMWVQDPGTGKQFRESQSPKNLGPMVTLLVDDLLHWYDGKIVINHAVPSHDAAREMCVHLILLIWCGDYPGLGEATNFAHAGNNACHWCKFRSHKSTGLQRQVFTDFRRSVPFFVPFL